MGKGPPFRAALLFSDLPVLYQIQVDQIECQREQCQHSQCPVRERIHVQCRGPDADARLRQGEGVKESLEVLGYCDHREEGTAEEGHRSDHEAAERRHGLMGLHHQGGRLPEEGEREARQEDGHHQEWGQVHV